MITCQIAAGERSNFSLVSDLSLLSHSPKITVSGIPDQWVRTSVTGTRLLVSICVPLSVPPGPYPLSITISDTDSPAKRTTFPITLEIVSTSGLTSFYKNGWSYRRLAIVTTIVIMGWLGFSYWRGTLTTTGAAPGHEPSLEGHVNLPPMAYVPVMIQAQWQSGLATPTIAPTPTLRPTPTPLPPLPTPQPPPAPPLVRTGESAVDGIYTYERMFQEVGAQFGIDWRLLASIANRESQLRPDAVGGSGEQGMMQIMPDTWNEFAPRVGENDPFNPYASTRVAAYYLVYLRDYLDSQGYTESYWLLVAYNWGPNNLRRHISQGGDWGSIPGMRQNYAYTIVSDVNDLNDPLWTETVLQEVP